MGKIAVKCREVGDNCGGLVSSTIGMASEWILASSTTPSGGVLPLTTASYETWQLINTAGSIRLEATTDRVLLEDGTGTLLKEY